MEKLDKDEKKEKAVKCWKIKKKGTERFRKRELKRGFKKKLRQPIGAFFIFFSS